MAIYVKNEILSGTDAIKHRNLWISNSDIEAQVLELKIRNISKIILVDNYGPPPPPRGKYLNFVDSLEWILSSIHYLHEFEIFITGDCNIPYNQSKC